MPRMPEQWPVKVLLVHPLAPFLKRDKLTVAADCAALVHAPIGEKFRRGETVIIGCPLLEDPDRLVDKLSLVTSEMGAKDLEVYTMEVPCCHVIHMMVSKALAKTGKAGVRVRNFIVRVSTGEAEPYRPGVIDESMIKAERMAHGAHCED